MQINTKNETLKNRVFNLKQNVKKLIITKIKWILVSYLFENIDCSNIVNMIVKIFN